MTFDPKRMSLTVLLSVLITTESLLEVTGSKTAESKFDPSIGSGRTAASCIRQLSGKDGNAREEQTTLPGGKSARINSKCNFEQWTAVRLKFLTDAWNRNYDNFNYYLEEQHRVSRGRPYNYFEDLCIACQDEPMLECEPGGRCDCWRHYVKESAPGYDSDTRCRIKPGDFCSVNSLHTGCVEDAFCDKDLNKCRCTTKPNSKCIAASHSKLKLFFIFVTILPLIC